MSVTAVNRLNYNFTIKVHLYFNKESYNRTTDSTPRFYLKPVKLLYVEKVAFTKKARLEGYQEWGNRFWKGKNPNQCAGEVRILGGPDQWKNCKPGLTTAKTLKIYKDIQENYPYGYIEGDPATLLKYELDVKGNESFQAFYSRYWQAHTELHNLIETTDSEWPHPYIEFTVNEIVTVKYPVGKVPSLSAGASPWAKYDPDDTTYEGSPDDYSCNDQEINVYVGMQDRVRYHIGGPNDEGNPSYAPTVHSSGTIYHFNLIDYGLYWPTGEHDSNVLPDGRVSGVFSGYKLSFSTGVEGAWNGHEDTEDDNTAITVQRIVTPKIHDPFIVVVDNKDSTHPWNNQGSNRAFKVDGQQGLGLTLKRGSTYLFDQSDETNDDNDGHPLYISSGIVGANADIYSSGVSLTDDWLTTGQGTLVFKVPFGSPDTLYYQCQDLEKMGGTLTIEDPDSAAGDRPGETVRVTFNQGVDGFMSYYCASGDAGAAGVENVGLSGMGGYLFFRKECGGQAASTQ